MKAFLLKTYLVVSIFFLGMLIGIFQNTREETPVHDREFVIQMDRPQTWVKKDVIEQDLATKQARVEKEGAINLFSVVGQSLAETVTVVTTTMFDG
ncbi:hypothetical protein [Bacillus sp. REN10]|uniref:hypothetical protein n=1 Tax=Bacillus sp. REN10 TaxID=2782541 RepID=UPI00193B3041|nr:hypothetical protein [Bacillus sp. REN10]